MQGGYHDRIAWIDLTEGTIDVRPMDAGDAERFMGGGCLGAAILARLVDGTTDPLGPGNPLIMMTGPFAATSVPAGSRHEVIALSPLTGGYGEANCGGAFGRQLKQCGLDGLVFTGTSASPKVLVIEGETLRLEEAGDLWGQEIYACDDALKARYGKDVVNAVIGPAGERMVPLATICHDGRHTRLAGRCGMGAVMGSKRLKAVTVSGRGSRKTPVARADDLKNSTKAFTPELQNKLDSFRTYGTGGGLIVCNQIGNLPIDNWRTAQNDDLASKITGTVVTREIQVKRGGCKRCPILCSRTVRVKDGPFATEGVVSGPEYETLAGFGSLLGNDDLASIAKANERCNQLGIDTISTAMVIAFAAECFEEGVITTGDTGGLELGFGKPEAMLALVERIGRAEDDFGRALGRGSRYAASAFGGSAAEYALEVKGLELPMHDPRFSWGQGLSYATGNRGACHLAAMAGDFENGCTIPELGYPESQPGRQREGKAALTATLQNLMGVLDSLVICKFTVIGDATSFSLMRDWYGMISGREGTVEDFMEIGERGFTLKRLINNRRDIGRELDTLPPRMRKLRKVGGDIDFDVPPLAPMLGDYYEVRGWTEDGRPARPTLTRLGLESFAPAR